MSRYVYRFNEFIVSLCEQPSADEADAVGNVCGFVTFTSLVHCNFLFKVTQVNFNMPDAKCYYCKPPGILYSIFK